MFRKLNSITLLAKAERAEATADKALAVVSKARSEAARQRLLAARVESEETAVRLEKKALSTELLVDRAKHDLSLASSARNKAEGELNAAKQNVEEAWKRVKACEGDDADASDAANAARVKVPTTESTE